MLAFLLKIPTAGNSFSSVDCQFEGLTRLISLSSLSLQISSCFLFSSFCFFLLHFWSVSQQSMYTELTSIVIKKNTKKKKEHTAGNFTAGIYSQWLQYYKIATFQIWRTCALCRHVDTSKSVCIYIHN